MDVSVEEFCARGQPAFAGAEWRGICLAGSQCICHEGRGTVSAGHGALWLYAYLVHCIAYAGPLT